MSKSISYICDKCGEEFTEDERTNVRGKICIKSALYNGEEEIAVNLDLCPSCANMALHLESVNVPLSNEFELDFEPR